MYMIRIHPVTSCNTEFWPICINIRLQNVRVSLQCTVLKNYLLARTEEISHEDQGTETLYHMKCHSFDYVNKKARITLDDAKRMKKVHGDLYILLAIQFSQPVLLVTCCQLVPTCEEMDLPRCCRRPGAKAGVVLQRRYFACSWNLPGRHEAPVGQQ